MPESKLVPHNCEACGYWTATEIIRTRIGWTLQCTHCGSNRREHGSPRAFRLFLVAMARFQQKASVDYPDLAGLTIRGAHLKFPPEPEAGATVGVPHRALATRARRRVPETVR